MKALKALDQVGIVSTSDPLFLEGNRAEEPDVYWHQALYRLRELGFKLRLGDFMSDVDAEKRASDFNYMVHRHDVAAIILSHGGDSITEILPYIDKQLFRQKPKIVMGQSDNSVLLNFLAYKTLVPTFHANNFMFGFGKNFTDFDKQELNRVACNAGYGFFPDNGPSHCVRAGKAVGRFVGGNLECFTKFLTMWPDFDFSRKILILESFMTDESRARQLLDIYRYFGVFEKIAGLVVGHNFQMQQGGYKGAQLEDLVLEYTCDMSFPILKVNSFGHCVGNTLIPIGARGVMDAAACEWGSCDSILQA